MSHHHHTETSELSLNRDGQASGDLAEQAGQFDEPDSELLTLTQAAKATGAHRSAIRRALDAGRFPNARQHSDGDQGEAGVWRIPTRDLLDAGYSLTIDGRDGIGSRNGVIDLREPLSGDVPAEADAGKALAILDGWRTSMHELAKELADTADARGRAEAKYDLLRERLAETRAERDRLAEALESERSRGWLRRRRRSGGAGRSHQPPPAAAAGGAPD